MRRFRWLAFAGVALTLLVIAFATSVYFRIEPLPSVKQMQDALLDAERRHHAERLRDIPSLDNLPAIEPMKIEQALILEEIGGLFPGLREGSKSWHPRDTISQLAPEMDFRVEYVEEKDVRSCQEFNTYSKDGTPLCLYSWSRTEVPIIVEVEQFPNEAWPLYFAKWSPSPNILQHGDPSLDITRVMKFKNRIVMDRQYRSADETGKLWFFWPSGKNLISITYRTKMIDDEFLRRYLQKYPSSL